MKKMFASLICLMFVLSLPLFSHAQLQLQGFELQPLQLQMPQIELQQTQMGQVGQLGRDDGSEPAETAAQDNNNSVSSDGVSSDMASANNFARETTPQQISLCEDGSATTQVYCSVSDDLLTVECFPITGPSRSVISFTPGSAITFFRPFGSHSFLVASEDGLFSFDTMTSEETEINVSPLNPTDIKSYVRATNPVSGLIMELILTNDNAVYLRQGGDPTTDFSLLITNSTNNLIGIDYILFHSNNFLGVLTDIGTFLLANIDASSPSWVPAADISSYFTSYSFSPATNGLSIRSLTDAISLSIIDENQESAMNVILPRQDAQAGEQQPEPLVSLEKTSPQILNACRAETEQRQLAEEEECPEGLVATEVSTSNGIITECLCEDGTEPVEEQIAGSSEVTYTCETTDVIECPEGLTLVDGFCVCPSDGSDPQYITGTKDFTCPEEEAALPVEEGCPEGDEVQTTATGEEVCVKPLVVTVVTASCPTDYEIITQSDGSFVCAKPMPVQQLEVAPATAPVAVVDVAEMPRVLDTPFGSMRVSGGGCALNQNTTQSTSADIIGGLFLMSFMLAARWKMRAVPTRERR